MANKKQKWGKDEWEGKSIITYNDFTWTVKRDVRWGGDDGQAILQVNWVEFTAVCCESWRISVQCQHVLKFY